MGLFNFSKKNKDENVSYSNNSSSNVVNIQKSIINLDKSIIDLTKKTGVNLDTHKAKVAVVLDYSGSMREVYNDGSMQDVLIRLMPLALKFDDDGELDVVLFTNEVKRVKPITMSNYSDFIKRVVFNSGFSMGCTSYAPALNDIYKKYIKEDYSSIPTFVIFITDGANDDRERTDEIVRELAKYNIFVQFVGFGKNSYEFDYLRKLDDLQNRECDNTGFIEVSNFEHKSDEELYSLLLSQYPEWLKAKNFV